jgi:predicted nucleotidyltransferase
MRDETLRDPLVSQFRDSLTELMPVTALIWFGSRSGGQERDKWSDYDFVVVSPEFQDVPFLDRADRLEPLRQRGVSYDLLCYTPEEFDYMSNRITIVREAVRTGIRLV